MSAGLSGNGSRGMDQGQCQRDVHMIDESGMRTEAADERSTDARSDADAFLESQL